MKTFILLAGMWLHPTLSASAAVIVQQFAPGELRITANDTPDPVDLDQDGSNDIRFAGSIAGAIILNDVNDLSFRMVIIPATLPDLGGVAAPLPGGYSIGSTLVDANYQIGGDFPAFSWEHEFYAGEVNPFDPTDPRKFDIQLCFVQGCTGYFRGQDAYIGFSLQKDDGIHYGWMYVDGKGDDGEEFLNIPGGDIRAIAFETEAGKPIITGVIPEPSVALMFFLAATMGLSRRRRCR